MPRRKRKGRIQAGPKGRRAAKEIAAHDLELAFVTAWPPITLAEVARRSGLSVSALESRSALGGWAAKRKAFQETIQREAYEALKDTAKSKIVEANKRHIKYGMVGQGIGIKAFRIAGAMLDGENPDIKPGEAIRAGSQAIKAGVEIERKGLGLADRVVFIQNVREIMTMTIMVLQQELGGHPDLLENTVRGLQKVMEEAEQKAGKMVIDAEYTDTDD